MNDLNPVWLIWLGALIALIVFGRKCYNLDRHCGLSFLLGFIVFVPAVLYIAGELWLLAFGKPG